MLAGKSAFLSYLLWFLLTSQPMPNPDEFGPALNRILFQDRKMGLAFLIVRDREGSPWTAKEVDLDKVQRHVDLNTIYIVDGCQPVKFDGGPTLLVTSPRHRVYKEFCKSPDVVCVFLLF